MNDIISFYSGYYPDMDVYQFACDAAYRDMCRTLKFADSTTNSVTRDRPILDERRLMKNMFRNIVAGGITGLNPTSYDVWHKNICDKLMTLYNNHISSISGRAFLSEAMTVGQAQKWLNMMMKHLWLLAQLYSVTAGKFTLKHFSGKIADIDSEEEPGEYRDISREEIRKILDWGVVLHIPLDSYILKYIAQEPKNPRSQNNRPQNTGINQIASRWNGIIMYEWSKIDNRQEYEQYQIDVRADLQKKGTTPIEWELTHWHKAIRFYDN